MIFIEFHRFRMIFNDFQCFLLISLCGATIPGGRAAPWDPPLLFGYGLLPVRTSSQRRITRGLVEGQKKKKALHYYGGATVPGGRAAHLDPPTTPGSCRPPGAVALPTAYKDQGM